MEEIKYTGVMIFRCDIDVVRNIYNEFFCSQVFPTFKSLNLSFCSFSFLKILFSSIISKAWVFSIMTMVLAATTLVLVSVLQIRVRQTPVSVSGPTNFSQFKYRSWAT